MSPPGVDLGRFPSRGRARALALARHLGGLVALLLASSVVVFLSLQLAPGSPESVLFGQQQVPDAVREAVRARYHLDDPVPLQYLNWLAGVLQGDFGVSIAYQQPVSTRIGDAAATTVLLAGYALVLILLVGVGLGALAALRPGRVDGLVTLLTGVAVATPTFVAATLLLSYFAVELGWFPVYGPGTGLLDRLWHLTLPAVALTIWAASFVARVTRAAMREQLAGEHVETARARGLAERHVIRRHVFRNALVPITTVAGLQAAGLIVGTVVVDQIFQLGGLGQLLVTAVNQSDFPMVQAICLLLVCAFVLVNTGVDLLYRVLDPRLRAAAGARR
nr:ABC transporter permease [Conexibacter arvalis]